MSFSMRGWSTKRLSGLTLRASLRLERAGNRCARPLPLRPVKRDTHLSRQGHKGIEIKPRELL